MLISARQAAIRLQAVGVSRRHARRLLDAGFVGAPVVTSSALLYDETEVERLAHRPWARGADLDAACPHGVFIARRDVDLSAPRVARVDAVRGGWDLSQLSRVLIKVKLERHGHFPFVATVAGFVALGGDIAAVGSQDGRTSFELHDPGPWFDALASHRLDTGPGNPYVIRGWPY